MKDVDGLQITYVAYMWYTVYLSVTLGFETTKNSSNVEVHSYSAVALIFKIAETRCWVRSAIRPWGSRGKLCHYTFISSPFIISLCRRSPERQKSGDCLANIPQGQRFFCRISLFLGSPATTVLVWWGLCRYNWLHGTCISFSTYCNWIPIICEYGRVMTLRRIPQIRNQFQGWRWISSTRSAEFPLVFSFVFH